MAAAATQLPNPALETPVIYKVKPGDTITGIVRAYYDAPYGSPRYQQATRFLQLYNPQVENLDRIRAGQMLRLMPLESRSGLSYCPAPDEYLAQFDPQQPQQAPYDLRPGHQMLNRYQADWPVNPAEESAFWALAMLQENYDWLAIPGGTAFSTLGNLTGQGNNALLRQAKALHESYGKGAISKGQYISGSRRLLRQYSQTVGPFEKFLMGGRTTQEAIRISRVRGLPATQRIESQLHRLKNLSKLATTGGVVLTAGGLYLGCREIANTKDVHKKNEIFVETATSTAVGGTAGILIGVALASNPVGWGVALVLAAGTAAVGWAAGRGIKNLYNKQEEKIDFVSSLNFDRICG